MSLYSGVVVDRKRATSRDGTNWLLIYTRNNSRPLAVRNGSIWPPNGSRVSAEVSPGQVWDFTTSQEISIDPSPALPYELEKHVPGVAGLLTPLILDWLKQHRTVSSDDVYDEAMRIIREHNRDPRILGVAFHNLARRGLIKKIGLVRSKRSNNHHYPNTAVWELVAKGETPS
jgi:hypothetical protein